MGALTSPTCSFLSAGLAVCLLSTSLVRAQQPAASAKPERTAAASAPTLGPAGEQNANGEDRGASGEDPGASNAATNSSAAMESTAAEKADGTPPSPESDEFTPSTSLEAARAEEREQAAKTAFRRGDRQYLEGNYEGAVRSFEEAYALSGRIEMLFNLANAHERLDNYSEASLALRGYIPHAPASNRDALEKRLARLEELAREARARTQAQVAAAPVVVQPQPEDRNPVRLSTSIGIGLLTLSGAGLITGTAFAISAANARAKLRNECEEGEAGRLCPPDAESLIDRDRAHSLVADVAFISSAALGATGLYLVLHKNEESGAEVRTSLGPGSLQVRGSF